MHNTHSCGLTRRRFLQAALGAVVSAPALSPWVRWPKYPDRGQLPSRVLGRTGARVTILGLGGQILLETPGVHDQAVELINRALDLGITYCDTAAGYYPSETYYGEVMAARRREVFLATKTADRTRDGAWHSIEQSLTNLQTDRVDLIQVHHLDSLAELTQITQPDGALAAMTEARDQGMVRFIGLSSHYADVMLAALDAFDFDTILCRVNPLDRVRGDFIGRVLPVARGRGLGIIAMKVMDRGGLLDGRVRPSVLLRYTLTHPVTTAIVGCGSLRDLEDNIATCRSFRPLTPRQADKVEQVYLG
jgi:aryl-alcohol dehydrogenase-like predicted oxidoreductase